MPVDWLNEFWLAAKQASPFGAMGAVICMWVLWRALKKTQQDLQHVTIKGIEALHQVERTLDSLIVRRPRQRRRR